MFLKTRIEKAVVSAIFRPEKHLRNEPCIECEIIPVDAAGKIIHGPADLPLIYSLTLNGRLRDVPRSFTTTLDKQTGDIYYYGILENEPLALTVKYGDEVAVHGFWIADDGQQIDFFSYPE